MVDNLSRRQFLKITAGTFGATAAGPLHLGCGKSPSTAKVEKIATFCEMCGWFCGAIAHVRDDKLWKLEGNPIDPGCRGRLCTRGTAGVGAHYDPDRLQAPLIRVGERGELRWQVATWDEAARLCRRENAGDRREVRPGGDRPVEPRLRRALHLPRDEGLRLHQHGDAVFRAVPRNTRHRVQADLR